MGTSRVLLVEDEENVRQVLAAFLAVDHLDVVEAIDGADGLRQLSEGPFDLIITDIMMPHKDGITMVREMRELPEQAEVPVLLISGHSDPAEGLDELSGPVAFISKPVTLLDFLNAVRQMLP